MKIGGLQKVTLVDYPGRIACTVFLSGCNFRCPFCYSKELVLPEEIKQHPEISAGYFFDFLKEKKGLVDAVVLCGGEPTVYGSELVDFCRKIKEAGFLIKLDTNGSNPETVKILVKENLIDYIAMDIKGPLDKYRVFAGADVDVEKIKESVSFIKNCGVDYEFRSTIVPGLHSDEDIIKMAGEISPAKKYFLQNFRGEKETIDPKFFKARPFPSEFVGQVVQKISHNFEVLKTR